MNSVSVVGDDFGKLLAKNMKVKYAKINRRKFPDGEVQPRVVGKVGSKVLILAMNKKRDEGINDYLMNVLLVSRELKKKKNKKIIGIIPYLPYARQDKIFRTGEPLSSKTIAEMLDKNLDKIVTIDMHEHRKNIRDLFGYGAKDVSVFSFVGEKISKLKIKEPLVIGPDYESEKFVKEFTKNFKAEYVILKKKRSVWTGKIKIREESLRIKNRNVIIVDDMVSQGRTILEAAKIVKKLGAKHIYLVFVHGVLSNKSVQKLRNFGFRKIISTNTIENPFQTIDITPEVANYVKKII